MKFGWKKKPNSKPEPPVIDRAPATKVRVSYHPEKKRVETKTNEQLSSEAFSTEKHFQDVMVLAFFFLMLFEHALVYFYVANFDSPILSLC